MPIKQVMIYVLDKNDIEEESEVRELVQKVREDITKLDFKFEDNSLLEVLKIIEEGHYSIKASQIMNMDIDINLEEVKRVLNSYRHASEKGCQSCKNAIGFHSEPDEYHAYCGVHETKDDVLKEDRHFSYKIEANKDTGCVDRVPIFKKTIEELLLCQ